METEFRTISPVSHVSLLQEDEDYHPQAIPMRIYRPGVQEMPPWLREEVAARKRQLNESRELDEERKLKRDHPRISDDQNDFVSEWLEGLPEKLVEGWEVMLREAGERGSSVVKHTSIIFDEEQGEEFEIGQDVSQNCEHEVYDEREDEFLQKVLLGRKRLMQAEISVKRLKMGLKHSPHGICNEFADEVAAGRTRDLLAAVDTAFEDLVRSRLQGVAEAYRERIENVREKDSNFMSKVYSMKEIDELKMMVADILDMDRQNGDTEGKQWFLRQLPRLLELREDMAQAEIETGDIHFQRGRSPNNLTQGEEFIATRAEVENLPVLANSETCDISIWDLYYYQYLWLRSEFGFHAEGPWEAFDISPEEEILCEDWELRIEQRIWLQENFHSSIVGARVWAPFRLELAMQLH